jgi:hypothetical protein
VATRERDVKNFVSKLAAVSTENDLVNHYATEQPELDRRGAAAIRRRNLELYLLKFLTRPPRLMIVGEAAGYRGNRFTGIAFTSEFMLLNHPFFKNCGFESSSRRPQPWREASACIIWETFDQLSDPFLLWGMVPFHPHKPGKPLSNRAPTRAEAEAGMAFFRELRQIFPSAKLVAAGRVSERMLTQNGFEHTAVRHPSHGGKADFQKGVLSI